MKLPVARPPQRRWWILFLCLALVSVGQATTVVPPNFADLVSRSDYVVRARVKAVASEIRTTDDRWKIFTKVELEVLEVIAGQPPTPLVLEFLGGKVDEKEMVVDGTPVLHVGEESILFVSGNGRTLCPLYAMGYGAYSVKEDATTKRRYVAREDQVPLGNVAEISQPLGESAANLAPAQRLDPSRAMTPEEFVSQIKTTRQAEAGHAKIN